MYYFSLVTAKNDKKYPTNYKKIFFILKDFNEKRNITLAEYYIKTYKHLIPIDVEFWEYDNELEKINRLEIK